MGSVARPCRESDGVPDGRAQMCRTKSTGSDVPEFAAKDFYGRYTLSVSRGGGNGALFTRSCIPQRILARAVVGCQSKLRGGDRGVGVQTSRESWPMRWEARTGGYSPHSSGPSHGLPLSHRPELASHTRVRLDTRAGLSRGGLDRWGALEAPANRDIRRFPFSSFHLIGECLYHPQTLGSNTGVLVNVTGDTSVRFEHEVMRDHDAEDTRRVSETLFSDKVASEHIKSRKEVGQKMDNIRPNNALGAEISHSRSCRYPKAYTTVVAP
ncbi:hypothetical protein BDM02DRAFT_3128884 [Thelephora ganbajun]|uniref:Uncharacterized protein n=1 Tax=Thelephora ganbajun TaxID=370292 RepID=A0ACB6ZGA1_THEGA|nr:hypothetical protein BDM02DRAFT_3128884 [Thelephora ganbajun]